MIAVNIDNRKYQLTVTYHAKDRMYSASGQLGGVTARGWGCTIEDAVEDFRSLERDFYRCSHPNERLVMVTKPSFTRGITKGYLNLPGTEPRFYRVECPDCELEGPERGEPMLAVRAWDAVIKGHA